MKDIADLPIVVVEDDPAVLSLFGIILEGQGYRSPLLFDSSLNALEFLRTGDAAAIILDLFLPDMSGLDLLRYVSSRLAHIPVIIVSGNSQIDTAIDCMKLGAVDYLRKPFTGTQIAASLTRALALRPGRGESEIPSPVGGEPLFPPPEGVPERLRKAAAFMEENLARPLYLEGIARQACLSKFHFCREFKKFYGMSPMHFMLRRRIALATSLLDGDSAAISEVAIQCGFSDQSEFTKWFKKATGVTPSRYRNARKRCQTLLPPR
ncbi:response regulator [Geomonas sp. RF6]|uniref:AraC family transcriptional regulator n=1 Tax=Geomonas sp. RF6 TaxID=2897342 RepID=UPI001E2C4474|nr:AraC family transcriptional regulator [Geomonas sp. RF6]UFS70925.1 response regulator [Geomonas sp. RF6]